MPEEEGQAEASATATETTEAPLVGSDGNLRENWQQTLDEDLREDKTLATIKSFNGAMRSVVNARQMVGKDKMVIPTAESGDEVWDAYHKIGGRPDTALDYGFKRPDDFPEEHWDDDFMLKAQEILHKGGASKKLGEDLLALNIESAKAAVEKQRQKEEFELDELNRKLDADWGLARDQKMHLGNIAVAEAVKDKNGVVNEEFKARLLEKVNKDPDLIRMVSNLGAKFSEHGVIHDAGIPTVGDLDAKIKDEMAKESYTKKSHPNHKNQVKLVSKLFQDKAATTKTG